MDQATGIEARSPLVEIRDLCERLNWAELFGNDNPVELDLGAGDGGFALAYARLHPQVNILAVERLLGRVRKIVKRAARQKLANVRVFRLELGYTVKYLLPESSVSKAHILFPDPWPKRRHWGRRLVQAPFVRDLAVALRPGGELRFTTDHSDYFASACDELKAAGVLEPVAELWDWESDPLTDFQKVFAAEGRQTHRACWRKS